MLNTKILIAALALALSVTALASCGRNVDTESTDSDTASVTESSSKETTGTTAEGMGTNGTTVTTENTVTEITDTESSETTSMDNGSETTVIPDGGDIVGRIGEDVQNGMGNVKRGVEDFFGGNGGMHPQKRGHRGPVPFGK